MSTELTSTGHFATDKAHGYMQQLCKHFGHKIPLTVEGDEGFITFKIGEARLIARDGDLQCTIAGADGRRWNACRASSTAIWPVLPSARSFPGWTGSPPPDRATAQGKRQPRGAA